MNNASNIRLLLIDEISLEGLDGITLQALWVRISVATNTNLPFPELLQKEYWNILRKIPDFYFYELPEPRPDLIPFDRFLYVDIDSDVTYYEPDDLPDDIYKHKTVNDVVNGVKGSCPTYYSRKDVTKKARTMEYIEAKNEWGNKLVIVASQELREYALIGTEVSNCIELTPIQYCVLERIGRSRHQGEITQGKRSLQVVGEDPKTLFYHRKVLLKFKLVTKQIYYQKCGMQNYSGTLLHLQRFFNEKKSKQLILTEQVVDFLKTRPNNRAQYSEIMSEFNATKSVKKIMKTPEFQRFIHTDLRLTYREYFPNSDPSQWTIKNGFKDKLVRYIQLIDPDIDVAEHWYEQNEDDEEEENTGFQNYGNLKYGVPLLSQAAEVVRNKGENGYCQSELGQVMGVNRLYSRSFCRNLIRRNVVNCVMNDVGRQRVTRFVSRQYEQEGIMTVQLKQEREKMINLMASTNTNISASSNNESEKTENSKNLELVDDISIENTTAIEIESNSKSSIENELSNSNSNAELEKNDGQNESLEEIVEPPSKKLKLITTQSIKRLLEDAVNSNEPPAKIMKTIPSDAEMELQKSLDNIKVDLIATKTVPGVKGYSLGFAEQFKSEYLSKALDGSKITYRLLKRANFIIEAVRELKVIADMTKLIKMIQENEKDEGYGAKIDKKSLVRLILKLAKEGHVKYIKASLICDKRKKSISFICDPNIDETHSVIQSNIEQAKMKFHLGSNIVNFKPISNSKTNTSQQILPVKKQIKYVYDRHAAKRYGFCPKFIRMRLIHEILFYLIYEEQLEPLTEAEEYRNWLEDMNITYDEKLIEEMTPVYHKKELTWRTFIPPNPTHPEWPIGWTLICDILLRMPLHMFAKCFSVVYNIDELDYYLNHPVRKYFLVKHLPAEIRNGLMYKRRYIFQMYEICSRLCYCGLLQFGPQKLKEKDQVFIYLNRKASILNTTTSDEGYHEISSKEYDKHLYHFENFNDVEQYWYDLWSTCMNTLLGGRSCVNGKYIILEQIETKPAMIEASLPRTPEEAILRDTGEIPGNHRGAAGLDSAIFAHLRRNWRWNSNNDINYAENPSSSSSYGTVKVLNPKDPAEQIEFQVKKHTITDGPKQLNKITKKPSSIEVKTKKIKICRKKTVVRKMVANKSKRIRKPFYDEIDKIALGKMGKLRTDWSQVEDHILLLCIISSKYLCPNRHRQIISFTVIRDVLHKLVKNSSSKTSRACQRRIIYIMKNINTRRSVQMCLDEMYQSETITKRYKDICRRIANNHIPEVDLNIAFCELVTFMSTMFSVLIVPSEKLNIPASIEKFRDKFRICGGLKKSAGNFKAPENINDITLSVIRTVIHSSMCCTKDKTSWAYQLFKIYQQYPENLLRSVISKTRREQMISLKKALMRLRKNKSTSVPLSSSPYQLSISYKYQLHSKLPYSAFEKMYSFMTELASNLKKTEDFEIVNPLNGTAIALMELTNKINLVYKFEIPDDIIVLDQNIQNDKTYERIINRYYNFLENPVKGELEENNKSQTEDDNNFPDSILGELSKKHNLRSTSSRIAFFMMRAEMCEGVDEKSVQHMHDFFVVNGCRIFINIPDLLEKEGAFIAEDLCEEYLEIKNEIAPKLLSEIKNNAIIPDECATENELLEEMKEYEANKYDISFIKNLIDHILLCGCFGSTNADIMSMLPCPYKGNICVQNMLDILINTKIVIQTGVEQIRYVHFQHKKPWIINSYKILRLDKEKIPTVTSASKDEMSNKLFRKRSNFSYLELQKSKQRLDLKSQQKVKILILPWIRIDGTLNRRVLDRWLGAVLIFCVQKPGITLEKLKQNFTYLRPAELANLIRCLVKLKCIHLFVIQKSKATLFSGITTYTTVPATGLEDPNDIFIESYGNALTKLAVFIGKKAYATDFLS